MNFQTKPKIYGTLPSQIHNVLVNEKELLNLVLQLKWLTIQAARSLKPLTDHSLHIERNGDTYYHGMYNPK